ncbi:hypothetical protein TNCV_624751 [Trichonephila clavipes]|nr:hypothetical protein TNCV_624751 [Trichonephila clavipes]
MHRSSAVQPEADGNTKVTLLVSKSRGGTSKVCINSKIGAQRCTVYLHAFIQLARTSLKEYDVHFYAWTNSQVVLSWLSSHPGTGSLTLPIEHRNFGLGSSQIDSWRYVPAR